MQEGAVLAIVSQALWVLGNQAPQVLLERSVLVQSLGWMVDDGESQFFPVPEEREGFALGITITEQHSP